MENVILFQEAEGFIQALEKFPLKEVGSARWFHQHEHIEKLNMQAVLDASSNRDEFVKELLVSLGKIPTLVHSMISVEIWKQKIFSIFCKLQDFNPKSSTALYMVIYHEATIMNLLETIMYHKDSCEAAEDAVVDLVDYCHRKLTLLIGKTAHGQQPSEESITGPDITTVQGLQKQRDELELEIALKALSVLRYITDHVESLGLSVLSRLLRTHNLPCVLVQLVEHSPWNRLEKYMDGKWREVPPEDQLKMSKQDGQVWITLLNLLLRPECQGKYDFNNFNKNQLLKLRGFLNDVLIDQLPNLEDLRRFLGHLAVTDPAPPKKDLILEQMPEICNSIMEENAGKWQAIAKHQVKNTFNPSDSELREQAGRLSQLYNLNILENLISEKPKCASCGAEATKRCSHCQSEWYCKRECQVKNWPKHKVVCQLLYTDYFTLYQCVISSILS
uniref:Zinc finger MYND domain-containing protein 10 n=1 Tax=Denticeps clupeoides TaxID=299321 RepID=A0AAY4E406_9TELE